MFSRGIANNAALSCLEAPPRLRGSTALHLVIWVHAAQRHTALTTEKEEVSYDARVC